MSSPLRFEGNNATLYPLHRDRRPKVGRVKPPTLADADVVAVDALRGLHDDYRSGKRP